MNPRNIQFNSETNILDLSNMTSHLNLFFFHHCRDFPEMYHTPFSQSLNWLKLVVTERKAAATIKRTSPHFISFGNKHGMERLLRFEFFRY